MLESMRRGAQTWVAKLLFGMLVVSFAIWGIADVFTGWGRGAIATIGDANVTADDFRRAYQNELDRISQDANKRITAEQGRALGLDRRVIAQLIGSAAIEEHAKQLGLALSDKTIVEGVQNDPDFHDASGKFSRQGFDALLRQIGLSEQGFLNLRRRDEIRGLLIGALVTGETVPKVLVDMIHAYNQETRTLEWLKVDRDQAVTVVEPDEAKLQEIYEAGKAQYMTPEYRKLDVLMLTVDDLKRHVAVSDEEISTSYAASKDSYDTPEQRRIQQISFKDKATAEAALKALRDGSKSFADVAKEAGAKDTDVDLGLVNRKALIDPKVAEAAFSLEKDKFSDVVEGRFATVILRVTQIEPGVTRTLDDVKSEVKDKLAAEKARAELQSKHDEVDDNRAAGKTLTEIAKTLDLMLKEVPAADNQGLTPDGKPAIETMDLPKIMSQAFSPDAAFDAEPVELTGGGYAWVHVASTEPPKQKTFDQVKDEVKTTAIENQRTRLVQELAKKLAERVNNGEPMSALEDAAKNKVQTSEKITRKTQPQGLSDAAVAQAFALAKGKAGHAPSSDNTTDVVFRVADIFPASAPTPTEAEALSRELTADLANQTLTEYTDSLKKRYGASINEAELKAALGVTDQ